MRPEQGGRKCDPSAAVVVHPVIGAVRMQVSDIIFAYVEMSYKSSINQNVIYQEGDMRIIKLGVEPFEMISILKYDEVQQMNEHGSARISGLIPYDKRDEYLKMAAKETWVKILGYDEEEKETILFYGKDTVRLLARIGLANMRFTSGYRLLPK